MIKLWQIYTWPPKNWDDFESDTLSCLLHCKMRCIRSHMMTNLLQYVSWRLWEWRVKEPNIYHIMFIFPLSLCQSKSQISFKFPLWPSGFGSKTLWSIVPSEYLIIFLTSYLCGCLDSCKSPYHTYIMTYMRSLSVSISQVPHIYLYRILSTSLQISYLFHLKIASIRVHVEL